MGTGKSDNLPVTNITWIQAAMFCNKLSKKEGFKPFYIINNEKLLGFDLSSRGYRLPTESEWEYVIGLPDKSGIKQKIYPWGNAEKLDESIANLSDINSGNKNVISNYVDEHKTLSHLIYPKTTHIMIFLAMQKNGLMIFIQRKYRLMILSICLITLVQILEKHMSSKVQVTKVSIFQNWEYHIEMILKKEWMTLGLE